MHILHLVCFAELASRRADTYSSSSDIVVAMALVLLTRIWLATAILTQADAIVAGASRGDGIAD